MCSGRVSGMDKPHSRRHHHSMQNGTRACGGTCALCACATHPAVALAPAPTRRCGCLPPRGAAEAGRPTAQQTGCTPPPHGLAPATWLLEGVAVTCGGDWRATRPPGLIQNATSSDMDRSALRGPLGPPTCVPCSGARRLGLAGRRRAATPRCLVVFWPLRFPLSLFRELPAAKAAATKAAAAAVAAQAAAVAAVASEAAAAAT